jgi:hypothetical protein
MNEQTNTFDIIVARKRPVIIVDFPDYDEAGNAICRVGIRTLLHKDNLKIQAKAVAETDKHFKSEGVLIDRASEKYDDIYENIAAKHILFEVCRNPENDKFSFFPTPDSVLELSPEEVAVLLKNWRRWQAEVAPIQTQMTQKEIEEWVQRLSEAGPKGAYFLDSLVPLAMGQLMTYMASQLLSYQTDKSYVSTQPNENGQESLESPETPDHEIAPIL